VKCGVEDLKGKIIRMPNEEKAPDIRGRKAWRQLQVWLLLEPGQYTSIRYIGQLAEAAGHESPYRMQALLRSYEWHWQELRAELPGPGAGLAAVR
jgi:hypothetical protein